MMVIADVKQKFEEQILRNNIVNKKNKQVVKMDTVF